MSNNKFISLETGKKEPPSGAPMVLWVKTGEQEWWTKATLLRIEFTSGGGRKYVFENGNGDEIDNATHYMIIEKPKE